MEDGQLVEQARDGDVAAYEALVRRYQEVAFRTAYLVLGDAAEAEDAAQEGFIKAYYALDRFRPGAPFRPWLLQITANEARNRKRSAGRRQFLTQRIARTEPPNQAAPAPETAALDDETKTALLDELKELPEMDRLVIAYRYFLDLSEVEMSEALDIPRGTVKSRLSRALQRLKSRLDTAETEGRSHG